MTIAEARENKRLREENTRLKRAVADLTLDNQILKEGLKEITEPGAAPQVRRSRPGGLRNLRTKGLPGAGPVPPHPALRPRSRSPGRQPDRRDQDPGPATPPLRLQAHHYPAETLRLEGEPQKSPAHLARAGAQGPCPAEEEIAPLAKGRALGSPQAPAPQPRLVLRLRPRADRGREADPILTVTDEYNRPVLAARARRPFTARDVIEVVGELMLAHGVPENIRSDNGPELTARALRKWLPGQPRQHRLHQARFTLGERLRRVLHLPGPGRIPGPRDLLHPRGSPGDAGALPDRLQHGAAALGAGLPLASGSDRGGGVIGAPPSRRMSQTAWYQYRGPAKSAVDIMQFMFCATHSFRIWVTRFQADPIEVCQVLLEG